MTTVRRTFLKNTAAAAMAAAFPAVNFAQGAGAQQTLRRKAAPGAPSKSQPAWTSSSRRA